jgi:hypothetical protein
MDESRLELLPVANGTGTATVHEKSAQSCIPYVQQLVQMLVQEFPSKHPECTPYQLFRNITTRFAKN